MFWNLDYFIAFSEVQFLKIWHLFRVQVLYFLKFRSIYDTRDVQTAAGEKLERNPGFYCGRRESIA